MIFDRTQLDIINTKAIISKYQSSSWTLLTKEEKQQLERGTFTFNSLNRIEQAQVEIAELLNFYDYKISIETKTNWSANDTFEQRDIERILNNIGLLRHAWNVYKNTPTIPHNYKPYGNANAIEKILFDMRELIYKMVVTFIYSGQIYSGAL